MIPNDIIPTNPMPGATMSASNDGAVDFEDLSRMFANIPAGPYSADARGEGWEVRAIDTDPTNSHHWPYRLCASIAGQKAGCDPDVFGFVAGVINAWPAIAAAIRTNPQQQEAGPVAVRPVAIGEEAEGYRQSRGEHWRVIFDALRDYRLTNMADEDGDNYPLVDRLSRDEPGTTIADGDMEMVWISDEISLALEAYAAIHPAPATPDETRAEIERLKRERDAQYDENVNRIAAEGAAILRCDAAEAKLAEALAATVPDGRAEVEHDLVAYIKRQWAWSRETFGPALRTGGVVDHIRKELREIEAEPHDLSEWVDVIILAMDGFWRHGGKPEELLPRMQAKQDKNFARTWPDWRTLSEDKAIEHDRSHDAALKEPTT